MNQMCIGCRRHVDCVWYIVGWRCRICVNAICGDPNEYSKVETLGRLVLSASSVILDANEYSKVEALGRLVLSASTVILDAIAGFEDRL